jgi:hypothetical protein
MAQASLLPWLSVGPDRWHFPIQPKCSSNLSFEPVLADLRGRQFPSNVCNEATYLVMGLPLIGNLPA